MKVQTGETIYLDAKPAPGVVVETGQESFRVYFSGINEEEPEVLEFEHRPEIDRDELNVIVSRSYQGLHGSTIPEDGEFFLDDNRTTFAVVQVFRVVPFGART